MEFTAGVSIKAEFSAKFSLKFINTVEPLLNSHPQGNGWWLLKRAGSLIEVKTIEKPSFDFLSPNRGDCLTGSGL